MRRIALLTTLAALALPAAAQAAENPIYKECQTGQITGTYTQKQYSDALKNIQTDLDEYTDCRDVIRRAQLKAAGKTSSKDTKGSSSSTSSAAAAGAVGGGSGTPPAPGSAVATGGNAAKILAEASPAERAAVAKVTDDTGNAPVQIGAETVSADRAGLSPAGAANTLPTPLVVALVLLAVGLAGGGAQTLRTLVRRRATPA